MQITRSSSTATGPDEWFTGTVYIETVAAPSEPSRLGVPSVHFMTHIAMQQVDDEGSPVARDEHVTDEEYNAAPPIGG